ncbi:hypothetical protein HMPREF2845_03830 [Rothia sp. HMSC065B04]|uniref:DUF421 domain-containing protein n=1 Tax=Rothia sp. HMSC065B04 TaxID=1739349 RepID=UPI0008A5BFE5|nr:YetF domain-containing protein [Rothia sp. HMSC065B04]OFJ76217.1 hypothetical protein HMPREF2845_03830 [Rothia sp. HMSC065B04]
MTVEMIVDGLLKIFIGLIILLVYLRLTHRSQAGHQTPIDTIGNFVIGGVFGGVLYSKQISLFYFVIYMVFTLCMIQLLNVATTKIRFLHMAVREQRVPVITDGDIDIKSFQQADVVLDPMRLIADLRAQGIYDLEDIEFAQIEPNGVLSVIRKGDGVPNFALIVKGSLVTRDIADAHKTEDWVYLQLRAAEVELEDVFLMEFKNGNRLLILLNDGTTIRREVAEASNMNDKEEEWQEGVEEAPEPEDTEDAKKEVAEHAAEDAHPTKDSKA